MSLLLVPSLLPVTPAVGGAADPATRSDHDAGGKVAPDCGHSA